MATDYHTRCAKFVESIRAMLGHGYGADDIEHMLEIVKARNAAWDRLDREDAARKMADR